MSQQKPRQRGGRVLDKATPEQVMGLARNLPLTHSVLEKALADATPGQLGFLANLFEKENASRAESKRRRLLKQAGFPQSKTLEGYDRGMASFPADRGRVYSADGVLLAANSSCWTLRASPREMPEDKLALAAKGLAEILELDEGKLLEKFSDRHSNDCLLRYRVCLLYTSDAADE